jgi:hypothetical protein
MPANETDDKRFGPGRRARVVAKKPLRPDGEVE